MNSFIESYFKEDDIFYIFLLNRNKDPNTTKQYYHTLETFRKFYEMNYKKWNSKGVDVYFSINTYKFIDAQISRKESFLNEARTLFFDIDLNGVEVKDRIIKTLGEPTYTIQTSIDKFQLFYLLNCKTKNFSELKEVSQALTYHFETDTTFDLARVARLPELINNKNGHLVSYKNSGVKYDLEHFNQYIKENKIKAIIHQKKTKKSKKEILKPSFEVKKGDDVKLYFVAKYKEFLIECSRDYSAADMKFLVYLIKCKKLTREKTIYKHFINHCEAVEERHKNVYAYYRNMIEKI